jgi:DNA polymerase
MGIANRIRTNPRPEELLRYCENLEKNGCSLCHLGKNGKSKVVVSRGNVRSPLVFVGQNPGKEEIEQGYPFVGPSGKYLDKLIEEARKLAVKTIKLPKDFYFTNAGLCGTPGNRPLTPEEQGICNIHLKTQLNLIAPVGIVAVGKAAMNALKPEYAKLKTEELFLKDDMFLRIDKNWSANLWYIYHPSYLLRNGITDKHEKYQQIVQRLVTIFNTTIKRDIETTGDLPF